MAKRSKKPGSKAMQAKARLEALGLPKIAETMLSFAKPLVDLVGMPPDLRAAQSFMVITTAAWNLPLLERHGHAEAAKVAAALEDGLSRMPQEVRETVEGMLRARLTTFGHDPRVGVADVQPNGRGGLRVVASASLLDAPR
ncbi:MAG: hypothetical protein U0414_24825 [Polyangiaceae bacterium]